MKRMIFALLMVFLITPYLVWGADDFDVRSVKIYYANNQQLIHEDQNYNSDSPYGDPNGFKVQFNYECNMRYKVEITFEVTRDIIDGSMTVELRGESDDVVLFNGDSRTYGTEFDRIIPSLNNGDTYTLTEYFEVKPYSTIDREFRIKYNYQHLSHPGEDEVDEDDYVHFVINGYKSCIPVTDVLPSASVIEALPDIIYDDDAQIFIGPSQRTDYRTVWQQNNNGDFTLVDSNYPVKQHYYLADNLVIGNCYSWKSYNHNSYGETESNTVSTCVESYNEDLAPELSTSNSTFVGGETITINISNVPNAFYYIVEKYRDAYLYDSQETHEQSFTETLSSSYSEYSFRARAHYSNGQDSLWGNYLVVSKKVSSQLPTKSTLESLPAITYGTSITLDIGYSENTKQRKIYQSINNSKFTLIDTVDEVYTYTVYNLVPGNRYAFYVVNINSAGTSSNSNTVDTYVNDSSTANLPPEISYTVTDSQFLGNMVGIEIYVHEPNDDNVYVEWFLDGKSVKTENLILPNRESKYEFTPDNIGTYNLRVVATDPFGASDEYEYDFNLSVARYDDPSYFQVISWSDGKMLYYHDGSLYDQEQFVTMMHNRFGSYERVIEPLPGMGQNWFSIRVVTPEELSVWDATGEVLLGLTDRCDDNTGSGCIWASTVFSSIPVVEEVQEGISIAANTVCFLYEGTAHFITGDPKYEEARKKSASNIGVAAVSILIPWVIDPQSAKVYYKFGTEAVPDAMKWAIKNKNVVSSDDLKLVDILLSSKGFSKASISAAQARVAKLKSLHPVIKEAHNVEFFAKMENLYGPERADYLVALLQKFERTEKQSTVLLPGFINSKSLSLANVSPEHVEDLFKYKYYLDNKVKLPGTNPDFPSDLTNANGFFAEERARFFFDLVGAKRIDSLENKLILWDKGTGYKVVEKGSSIKKPWEVYAEYDAVRTSPYNEKEIWFTEVKNGQYESHASTLNKQLNRITPELLSFLADNNLIKRDSTVRRIAMADEKFDELSLLNVAFDIFRSIFQTRSCYADTFSFPISVFIVPAKYQPPPANPVNGNAGHVPAIMLLLGGKPSNTILPPGGPGEQ